MLNLLKKKTAGSQSIRENLIWKLGPMLLFLFVWAIDTAFVYKYCRIYLDSDMASEMVLANLLNKEGKMLSTNWFYSSEIRIIGHVRLFKPLLLLFPNNWQMVRTVAESILILLTGCTYIYVTSVLEDRRKCILFAAISMCPFGFLYMWQGIFCGFYLLWVILYGFCGGLMLRIVFGRGKNKYFQLIILAAISLVIGLQSIRGLLNLQLPMFLVALILWYLHYNSDDRLKEKIYSKSVIFLKISLFSICFSVVGYAVNTLYLSKKYTYFDQNDKLWQDFSFSKLLSILEKFIKLWGFPNIGNSEISLFSINGLLSCFALLFILFVLISFIILVKCIKNMSMQHQAYSLTAIMMMLVPYIVFVFFQEDNSYIGVYFLPNMAFFIAGLQIALENYPYKLKVGKKLVMVALLLTVAASSVNTVNLFLKNPPRSNSQMVTIAETLLNEGYTQCIATFWNANVVTELTDGQIEVWSMENMSDNSVHQWLQEKDHVQNLPTGKCAMIFDKEDYDSLGMDLANQVGYTGIYMDDKLVVIGTDDIEAWWDQIKK